MKGKTKMLSKRRRMRLHKRYNKKKFLMEIILIMKYFSASHFICEIETKKLFLVVYQRMPILVFDTLSGSGSQNAVVNMRSLNIGAQEQLL